MKDGLKVGIETARKRVGELRDMWPHDRDPDACTMWALWQKLIELETDIKFLEQRFREIEEEEIR